MGYYEKEQASNNANQQSGGNGSKASNSKNVTDDIKQSLYNNLTNKEHYDKASDKLYDNLKD